MPSAQEQKKIARIFLIWDKAIEAIEKLIENSKAQKKALMQQLLTGQRRFPGFTSIWRDVHLCDIAEVLVSNVDKKISSENEKSVRLCNYTDVYHNDYISNSMNFMVASATQREIEKFKLLPGDVLITKDSETPNDIAVAAYVQEELTDVICGYHLAIIRPMKGYANGLFLSKLFSIPTVKYYFFSLANGVTRFGLGTGSMSKAKLTIPDIQEQVAIGRALQTMDLEIINQSKQLTYLKEQKKALMQQLLTGKRRVKVDES
jgi:type I restriction enzyme S subunit